MKKKHRKLAAIMFCDIESYTSLMQKDEAHASILLQKFRNTLNEKVTQHSGEVINNYGDGCLCTFVSAVDAMTCANAVQLIFQTAPQVPVRIGLHSGDVFFEDDNVFGDSVNIASRIESLGVAGAVLFSEPIKRHISNQKEFEVESLGGFEFKNVEEPMEVFALTNEGFVVPRKDQMKGKLKSADNNKMKWIISALIAVLLIAGLSYWQLSTKEDHGSINLNSENFSPSNTPLPKSYTEQRVAILPIKNNTNDSDLDILGTMASDWITRGLMEIEGAEVVSPNTVIQNLDAIGILPNNLRKELSFNELTGAQNYIQGNFYKEQEDLIFLMQLVDAIGGKILFNFPEIRGDKEQREGLITQLRENITGYWAAQEMVNQKKIKVPKYEAYKLYMEWMLGKGNLNESMVDILSIDSTFYLARLMYLNVMRGRLGQKAHFDYLTMHLNELSQYEKYWYDYLRAYYLGQPKVAFEFLNELRKKYPKDFSVNHECAALADEGLNNPQLSLDIYDELKIDNASRKSGGFLYNWRVYHKMMNYFKIRDLEGLENYYNTVQPNSEAYGMAYNSAKLLGAAMLKKEKDVDKILNSNVEGVFGWIPSNYGYSNIWTVDQRQKLLDRGTREYKNRPNPQAYQYMIETWEGKETKVDFKKMNKGNTIRIRNLRWAAIGLIDKGKMDQIPNIIKALEEWSEPSLDISAVFGAAHCNYILGMIYTKLGDFERGLQYLKNSRELGYNTEVRNYQYDINLEPLYEMTEFKEIIKPIWPGVKN